MRIRILEVAAVIAVLALPSCGTSGPAPDGLKDSFAQQIATNKFIRDFQRNGDELTFTGPGAEGGTARWRVQIDSAVIEANDDPKTSAAQPYKGTVKSSWYSDGQIVRPGGGESNLPFELISNGISQDCWAYGDETGRKWSWE